VTDPQLQTLVERAFHYPGHYCLVLEEVCTSHPHKDVA
jgi:hypothetical protein